MSAGELPSPVVFSIVFAVVLGVLLGLVLFSVLGISKHAIPYTGLTSPDITHS